MKKHSPLRHEGAVLVYGLSMSVDNKKYISSFRRIVGLDILEGNGFSAAFEDEKPALWEPLSAEFE